MTAGSLTSGSPWADPAAADRSDLRHWARVTGVLLVLTLITVGDLVMIKTTLNIVLGDKQVFSWLLGIGVTISAVSLMVSAGSGARVAVARGSRRWPHRPKVVVLTTGWALLGAGLTILRWTSGFTAGLGGAEDSTTTDDGFREPLMALVLLGIYIATGLLAYTDGDHLTNPIVTAMRNARREQRALERQLRIREGRVERLVDHLAAADHELDQLRIARQQAIAEHEALAASLKEWARIEIAKHLNDPASTGLIRFAPKPRETTRPRAIPTQ